MEFAPFGELVIIALCTYKKVKVKIKIEVETVGENWGGVWLTCHDDDLAGDPRCLGAGGDLNDRRDAQMAADCLDAVLCGLRHD
jgi:hypothetical protein